MESAFWAIDLHAVNGLSIIVRLLLASLIGGLIGLDRELIQKPAGIRTYMLICIGSALAMLTNQYIAEFAFPGSDPARFGAQVLSGIGFLGAGTIIVVGKLKVSGLTTAAGLWASAAAGLACGIGFYGGAIIGGIFLYIIIAVLHRIDRIGRYKHHNMSLCIELENISKLNMFTKELERNNIVPHNLSYERIKETACIYISMTLELHEKNDKASLHETLLEIDGVTFVQDMD